jgi:hypothetical protein
MFKYKILIPLSKLIVGFYLDFLFSFLNNIVEIKGLQYISQENKQAIFAT